MIWRFRKWLYRWWYRNIYLWSPHWRLFRAYAIRKVGHRCEAVGCLEINRLDVHHLSYAHLGHETMNDVRVVCRYHHVHSRDVKYRPRKS